jgi:hypothetical protein
MRSSNESYRSNIQIAKPTPRSFKSNVNLYKICFSSEGLCEDLSVAWRFGRLSNLILVRRD